MHLGASKSDIVGKARDKTGRLRDGDNTIILKMNGHDATVQANIRNGELRSMDIFPKTSNRQGQNVIDLR